MFTHNSQRTLHISKQNTALINCKHFKQITEFPPNLQERNNSFNTSFKTKTCNNKDNLA